VRPRAGLDMVETRKIMTKLRKVGSLAEIRTVNTPENRSLELTTFCQGFQCCEDFPIFALNTKLIKEVRVLNWAYYEDIYC